MVAVVRSLHRDIVLRHVFLEGFQALGEIGQSFAVGRFVMDDGDFLVLECAERQIGPELALLLVGSAGAEHVPQTASGDLRVGGRGRDHQ